MPIPMQIVATTAIPISLTLAFILILLSCAAKVAGFEFKPCSNAQALLNCDIVNFGDIYFLLDSYTIQSENLSLTFYTKNLPPQRGRGLRGVGIDPLVHPHLYPSPSKGEELSFLMSSNSKYLLLAFSRISVAIFLISVKLLCISLQPYHKA